ncbi:permease for cytosine/purines, uracil, thiamine, allantoin-domain-containing protein [Phaeosphaeria sp. MPI-PUGE-AT-0046c]|nr:permease for cytosine/purines, uracil, thiamine, allantoin-domain-containing protein [Phaeosphaeria sp. MPI-PUGE-AT-0046c]
MSTAKIGDNAASISSGSGSGGMGETTTSYATKRDTSFLGRLRAFEATLDAKMGIESDAITRKLPEDKKPVPWHHQMTMFFLWASGTMNTSCFATGFLGWEFGLTLRQSIVITIFASILGGAATGFAATFGAPTGLRQISVSRYAFGWWPNKVIAALNTIVQIGWAAVACITGGLALTAVADGHISLIVGIVILAVVATLISFVGLKAILVYERYAWFIFFIIFIIFFAETGKYADNSTKTELKGADLSGAVLSLIAIVYGSSASWQTMASDYYVHYPVNVNRWKVFLMTTFGIAIPTSIGMVAGCVVSSGINNRPDWKDVYENQGLGFLIQTMLYPRGFAKLILTLLVLSGINVNVISIYSAAISCQQFARPFARVPRFIWVLLCFAAILGLAIGGREKLSVYLQNFLSLLGYWSTQYFVILFSEHIIFRRMSFDNYDLDAWNDPKRLPLGIAAGTAFAIGIIAWVMGMVETWYVGPLGKLIGSTGGDVANEFTFAVTALIYIPARFVEKRMVGR